MQEQVDELDAGERHDEAAQPVDEQVVAQQLAGRPRRYFTPRRASGMRKTMMMALKMTAERMALCGRSAAA